MVGGAAIKTILCFQLLSTSTVAQIQGVLRRYSIQPYTCWIPWNDSRHKLLHIGGCCCHFNVFSFYLSVDKNWKNCVDRKSPIMYCGDYMSLVASISTPPAKSAQERESVDIHTQKHWYLISMSLLTKSSGIELPLIWSLVSNCKMSHNP